MFEKRVPARKFSKFVCESTSITAGIRIEKEVEGGKMAAGRASIEHV